MGQASRPGREACPNEEAVRWRIFHQTVQEARRAGAPASRHAGSPLLIAGAHAGDVPSPRAPNQGPTAARRKPARRRDARSGLEPANWALPHWHRSEPQISSRVARRNAVRLRVAGWLALPLATNSAPADSILRTAEEIGFSPIHDKLGTVIAGPTAGSTWESMCLCSPDKPGSSSTRWSARLLVVRDQHLPVMRVLEVLKDQWAPP